MATNQRRGEIGFWHRHRVLVTGATGLVGSWLVKELVQRGALVTALIRDADPQSELIRSGDISQLSVVSGQLEDFATIERAVNEYEVQTVFHLGAQALVAVAQRSPVATFESNIRGTYNVLEACRRHRVPRVVVASSDKAYGTQTQLPYTEDSPLHGRYPYEVSKSCADLLAQSYAVSYGLPVTIARCGNVYGGGDLNWSRIIPGTIRSLLRQQRPLIRSDGQYVRDYFYVEDVAGAYITLAEHLDEMPTRGEAFNFSAEQPLTVLALVQIICQLMQREQYQPMIQNVASGEIVAQYLSAMKAREQLGWRPRFSLEEGLTKTIAWYRDFLPSEQPDLVAEPAGLTVQRAR